MKTRFRLRRSMLLESVLMLLVSMALFSPAAIALIQTPPVTNLKMTDIYLDLVPTIQIEWDGDATATPSITRVPFVSSTSSLTQNGTHFTFVEKFNFVYNQTYTYTIRQQDYFNRLLA